MFALIMRETDRGLNLDLTTLVDKLNPSINSCLERKRLLFRFKRVTLPIVNNCQNGKEKKNKGEYIFANRISRGNIFFLANAIYTVRPGISINFSPVFPAFSSRFLLTQHVAFVPISVPNLEIVAAAKIAFEYIQRRNIEDYSFAMRGRDPPFASLALGWRGAVRMCRRSETSAVFLKRSAALCGKIESAI